MDASCRCSFLVLTMVVSSQTQTVQFSPPQYVAFAKCNFVVFGEFDYEQAKIACETRKASLAFFASTSEEHAIRRNIDWNSMPGMQWPQGWFGQLWVGIRKKQGNWVWDNPILQDVPLGFTVWSNNRIGCPLTPYISDFQCVMIRADGWIPANCNGKLPNNLTNNPSGALCSTATRFPPNDPTVAMSTNYCDVFLLPPISSTIAWPGLIKKNYFLSNGLFTFDQTVQECGKYKAQPITSRSAEEFVFIPKNVDFRQVDNKAWLGLKRAAAGANDFLWIDMRLNAFNGAWLTDEPSQNGDCVAWEGSPEGVVGWKVYPCTATMAASCEIFIIL